jgi:hypothetical protein
MSSDPHDVDVFPGDLKVKEGSIPFFLKLTYIGFVSFAVSYWFLYNRGDIGNHKTADGTDLVQKYNELTNK